MEPKDDAVKAANDWEEVDTDLALEVLGDEHADEDVEDAGCDYSSESRG